jgi:hypothetical protein
VTASCAILLVLLAYMELLSISTHWPNISVFNLIARASVDTKYNDEAQVDTQSAWCSSISLSDVFSDDMLLQRDARAAVYGTVGSKRGLASLRRVRVDVLHKGVIASQSSTHLVRGQSVDGEQDWKVLLPAQPAGTNYTIRAYCVTAAEGVQAMPAVKSNAPYVQLNRVGFGDVFFCGGQSNMDHTLAGTFEGVATLAHLMSNPVQLRLTHRMKRRINKARFVGSGGEENSWVNLAHPHSKNEARYVIRDFLSDFSSTCLQFGLSLMKRLGDDNGVPIGLVQACVGGSLIEQWASKADLSRCKFTRHRPTPAQYFNGMVAPLVNMTLRGWVYYQGENNLIGASGNSADGTGYGCTMPTLIEAWRRLWSVEPDTTPADGVFGLVTLAAGTDEGNPSKMSAFRWSQTANYGVAPNPKMPNVSGGSLCRRFVLSNASSFLAMYYVNTWVHTSIYLLLKRLVRSQT